MRMLSKLKKQTFAITLAASTVFLNLIIMTNHTSAQDKAETSPLAVRVAVFAPDQSRPDNYRDFVSSHLFPALRSVPGYVGTFLGKDMNNGQMVSISFWRTEAGAVAGEQAVGRSIATLPPGSAPRPSTVSKYEIIFRDINEPLSK